MELIKYIILGILQGITEPLPISSSGHIYIFKAMFNTAMFDDLSLEIFLNFASFIAIFIIFRKNVIELIKGFFNYIKTKGSENKNEFKYCWMIVLGTIPVGILGILTKNLIEGLLSKNVFIVGIGFLITAISLILVSNAKGRKNDADITWKEAVIIGLFQAISIIPGISRSGMTLVGCLACGLSKKSSLKYTFMLYFPVSIATMLLGVLDIQTATLSITTIAYYISGMIMAGLFTYISYNWLNKIVEKGNLWKFSLYLFVLTIFTLMFFI